MRISATGFSKARAKAPPDREAGFTLIEILVVVTIVAIVTGAVVLQVRLPAVADPQSVRVAVAGKIKAALDEAMFNGRNLAFNFSRTGIEMLAYDDTAGSWSALREPNTLAGTISFEHVAPTIEIEGRRISLPATADETKPDAFILSSGETTPFRLLLAAADAPRGSPVLELDVDPYGRVATPDTTGR